MNFNDDTFRRDWYRKVQGISPSLKESVDYIDQPSKRLDKPIEIISKNELDQNAKFDDSQVDILVLSALQEEHLTIKRVLFGRSNARDEQRDGQFFTVGEISNIHQPVTVAVSCFGQMGMVAAGILTTRAMISMKPKIVIIGGICAGVEEKTRIGDIVIGSDMFNYDSKKIGTEKTQYDYPLLPIHWDIQNAVNSILEDSEFLPSLRKTWSSGLTVPDHELTAHVAPFASGSAVVANGEVFGEIKDQQRRVRGLDMEVFGVAKAVHYDSRVKFLAVKSVSDFGAGDKDSTINPNDIYREFCCAMSAGFIKGLIQKISYQSLFKGFI